MSLLIALTMLEDDYEAVRDLLPAGPRARLDELVAEMFRQTDPGVLARSGEAVGALLIHLPPWHEIAAELRRGMRLVDGAPRTPSLQAVAVRLASHGDPARPDPDVVAAALDARLLARDSLEHADLAVPDSPDLIRLDPPHGASRWPAFQFDADGVPRPIVQRVNAVLGSVDDPYGVADWWLGENAWLGGVPADLIGEVPDARLLAVAHAAVEGE